MLLRSPPLAVASQETTTPAVDRSPEILDSVDLRSPPATTSQETTTSAVDMSSKKSDFVVLGELLSLLVTMLDDGKRRSVNQQMRDAITNAKALHVRIGVHQREERSKAMMKKENSSQTSPILKLTTEHKRKQKDLEGTPRAKRPQTTESGPVAPAVTQKRHQSDGKAPEVEAGWTRVTKERRKKQEDKNQPNPGAPDGMPKPSQGDGKASEAETGWTKVTRKRRKKQEGKKQPKPSKSRPDAIIIKSTGEKTYAEIIRQMQADPKLESLGNAVSRIRRTQKGELLIQLKPGDNPTSDFKEGLEASLGQNAEVKPLTSLKTIECKDINEATTVQDIVEAIKTQIDVDGISEGDVKLRKAYGETQTATIRTTEARAKKLLHKGELRLGWSICHLREKTILTKCFRCLEFGHIARSCKGATDRSRKCRKCGEEGHIAKNCSKNPSCMFCVKDHPDNANHVAGSNSCPVFKKALSKKK